MADVNAFQVGDVTFGGGKLSIIAGPCVVESEELLIEVASKVAPVCARLGIPYIFKSSYRKANRTSSNSFTGIGDEAALKLLKKIHETFSLPVVSDVHAHDETAMAAEYLDVLQIPAFLCRQTDLLVAAAQTGRVVNIKKGQFLAPADITHAVAKVVDAGNNRVMITERGTSFGYNNLIVDMRAFPMMRERGVPVVFDVTHSLQLPGAGDGVTAGLAQYIEPLASAGVAAGVDGVFMEVHEEPTRAKSDAQNALRLDRLEPLLRRLMAIDAIAKQASERQPAL